MSKHFHYLPRLLNRPDGSASVGAVENGHFGARSSSSSHSSNGFGDGGKTGAISEGRVVTTTTTAPYCCWLAAKLYLRTASSPSSTDFGRSISSCFAPLFSSLPFFGFHCYHQQNYRFLASIFTLVFTSCWRAELSGVCLGTVPMSLMMDRVHCTGTHSGRPTVKHTHTRTDKYMHTGTDR